MGSSRDSRSISPWWPQLLILCWHVNRCMPLSSFCCLIYWQSNEITIGSGHYSYCCDRFNIFCYFFVNTFLKTEASWGEFDPFLWICKNIRGLLNRIFSDLNKNMLVHILIAFDRDRFNHFCTFFYFYRSKILHVIPFIQAKCCDHCIVELSWKIKCG